MTILSRQGLRHELSEKGRTVAMVCYDLKLWHIYDPETGLLQVTRDTKCEEAVSPLKVNKLDGGGLSSTLPSVHPSGRGFELKLPPTLSDAQGPIVPVSRTPPASLVGLKRRCASA